MASRGKAPAGGRPVINWHHGTTGAAANRGPSQIVSPAKPLNLFIRVGGDSWTDHGLPLLEQFIKAGYVVVGTDYQGLGIGWSQGGGSTIAAAG